jgi:hypothetical protein
MVNCGEADEIPQLAAALDACTDQFGADHPETLGVAHKLAITCVLAWNRALSYERRGDGESAHALIASELTWLLVEDPSSLESDQNTIRGMLAEHLHWDAAIPC